MTEISQQGPAGDKGEPQFPEEDGPVFAAGPRQWLIRAPLHVTQPREHAVSAPGRFITLEAGERVLLTTRGTSS